jgi:hypothetical protein
VLGAGLAQGRIVMMAYSLLAVLGLYQAGRLLYGSTIGLLAVVVLCATDQAGPVATRTVVGEIVAIAYLFWGVAVFALARASGRAGLYVAAGLLFGLAVLTKGQFGLLLPALVGAWLLTRRQPGGFPARQLVAVLAALLAPVVLWQGYQLVLLGAAGYIGHLRDQSAALSVSANVPLLSKTVSAIHYLLSSQVATLGLAALAYMWLAVLARGLRREPAEQLVLPGFAAAWLVWYVGMSMGWARYAVPLIAANSLFVAVLIRDLIRGFWTPRGLFSGRGRLAVLGNPTGTALVLVLAAPIVSGVTLQLHALARPPEASAQKMAAIIARNVDPAASTESLEWELDVLAGRTLHHPPPFVPNIPYEVPATTAYLVDGPMSKLFSVYSHELEQRTYRRIASVGAYDLYRRDPAPEAVH